MGVTHGNTGAGNAGTTSLSVAYPTSISAGHLLILCIINKYPSNSPSTPGTWTLLTQATGGAGASGNDSGQVYATVYWKIASGSESGNQSVTITSGNSAVGFMSRYVSDTGAFATITSTTGSDGTQDLTWTSTGAAGIDIASGDLVLCIDGLNTDAPSAASAQTLVAIGATLGSFVERRGIGTNQGQDCAGHIWEFACSAGSSSSTPVLTATYNANCSGATVFIRLRSLSGAISATGNLAFSGAADINAKGSLSLTNALAFTGVADINAKGSLSAVAALSFVGAGDINARGALLATGVLAFTGAGDTNAPGKLGATGVLAFTTAADLTQLLQNMTATGSLAFVGVADINALGKLLATGSLAFTTAADLKGLGKLGATGVLVFGKSADLTNPTGSGISATGVIVFTPVAQLRGLGKLEATGQLQITGAQVTLNARGDLEAVGGLVFSESADLTAAVPTPGGGGGGSFVFIF